MKETYETEAMAASNEQLRAVNKHLRSTNEELAAAKEDLQVVHDELQALNEELWNKLEKTNRINSDLQDLVTVRTEQIKQLTSELILSEQAERQRIAQLLHDDLQQLLIAFQIRVTALSRSLSDKQAARLGEAGTLIAQALNVTRTLTVELSPPVLSGEDADITTTLDWLALRMAHVHKLKVEVVSTCPVRVPGPINMLMYQVTRELLFNVVKHAGVDRARVKLIREEDRLLLVVEDDGAGFDPAVLQPTGQGGFGLRSMRQRLSLLGGCLEVDAAPGRGTRMMLFLPLKYEPAVAGATHLPNPRPARLKPA